MTKLPHAHDSGANCLACAYDAVVSEFRDYSPSHPAMRALDRIAAAMAEREHLDAPPGGAYIYRGFIMIRVAIDALPDALELNPLDFGGEYNHFSKHITDLDEFSRDVVRALNHEAEDGTTMVHELFDNAMAKAIDGGSIAIDYDAAERARKGQT